MRNFLIAVICALFTFGNVNPAAAQSANPVPATTSAEATRISEPTFVFNSSVLLDQNYDAPVFASGGIVNFTGSTTQDLVIAGGTVKISGTVGQDVYVAGGTVMIEGEVLGNVIAAGGEVKVDSLAMIAGSVIAAAERLEVGPFLQKSAWFAGDNILVYQGVNGNLNVASDSLYLAPSASIAGNLEAAVEPDELIDQASVAGSRNIRSRQENVPVSAMTEVWELLYTLLARFLFLSVALFIFPTTIFAAAEKITKNPGKIAVSGMVWLAGLPLLALLLLITAIGAPLAVFICVLYVAVVLLSWTIPAMALGSRLLPQKSQWLQAGAAVLVLSLLGVIPIVGTLVQISLGVLGAGSLWQLAREVRSKTN
jgi:cytoskeletal protein CcmA (bactofilin family)